MCKQDIKTDIILGMFSKFVLNTTGAVYQKLISTAIMIKKNFIRIGIKVFSYTTLLLAHPCYYQRVQYNKAFRLLLGPLWRFSAWDMFADAPTDGFLTIMRKRCTSALQYSCGSSNSILHVFSERWDSRLQQRWNLLHVRFF